MRRAGRPPVEIFGSERGAGDVGDDVFGEAARDRAHGGADAYRYFSVKRIAVSGESSLLSRSFASRLEKFQYKANVA